MFEDGLNTGRNM